MSDLMPLDGDIWHWCDMNYGQNKALCLKLQDCYRVNVNLLLLAHYLDISLDVTAPRKYSLEQWQILVAAVSEWDEQFLTPYRRLRRLAKASLNQDEYQQILDVELMIERKVQGVILNTINELTPNGRQANLVIYLSLFGLSAIDVQQLGLISP